MVENPTTSDADETKGKYSSDDPITFSNLLSKQTDADRDPLKFQKDTSPAHPEIAEGTNNGNEKIRQPLIFVPDERGTIRPAAEAAGRSDPSPISSRRWAGYRVRKHHYCTYKPQMVLATKSIVQWP